MKAGPTIAAIDADDLAVISAQLQDAIARVHDLAYLPKTRRFAGVFNRFKWEEGGRRNLRVRSGLHFENVLGVKALNLRQDNPFAVVSLLAIRFTANDPADCTGRVDLLFAGGGELRLDVECLDATLTDLSDAWAARGRPAHDTDEQ
ncbi:MAG: DUF2948 family protein [Alphaproteobacteria bacterium]|jgi:hypothetical protein|nr:DUF2948 family protein [Alphaproteobacteria bacterium]